MGETAVASKLSALNDPPRVLEGPQLLHGLIDFELHADACALDFSSNGKRTRYSYREIQLCAQSLAYSIGDALDATRQPETHPSPRQHIIPILLPQSPALYVAQLAILESGGAFCPINLDAPQERIKFVAGDVKAEVIITTAGFEHVTTWENGPKVILIDELPNIPRVQGPRRSMSRGSHSQGLAYVMYTSGSSGTPKGVAVSHLAASQSLLAHERHIPHFKRFLQFASPSFDVSVFEIFFPLKRGATLVGCERSHLLDDLPGVMNDLQVDAAEFTPTVVGSLLQKRSNTPRLKLLLTIGEMLTRPIVEEFGGSETKESILYGMYGPTEAAIHCTINAKMSAISSPSNIGVPLDTVSTFVAAAAPSNRDGSLHLLGIGELGELVLGGPQLAQGYLNREEQNKAAFIHSSGNNYYRTGDKARILEDGTIEILGRMSAGQVKLRGQRIELGEIEEAVYRHPSVKTASAAVIANVLIVFALVGDQSLKTEEIAETCAKWLPRFMIPSEIILEQQFPYLPSGKVDKKTLQSDYEKRLLEDTDEDDFSSTLAEIAVKNIIQRLLGSFSRHMRLAAAGLDSLVAIRVATLLRESGLNVSTLAVLQAETPLALAKMCDESASTESRPPTSILKPISTASLATGNEGLEDIESALPCTPLQSAMLFETASDEKAYRNWIEVDLSNITSSDQVISALYSLAQCNPILRTGFIETENGDGFAQIVRKAFDASRIENVKELTYSFDPLKDVSLLHPMRIQIQHLPSRSRLLMHIHHALYDAWSLELLLDDLDTLLIHEEPIKRPTFASLVDGYLDGTIGSDTWASRDYWKDHLAHLELRQFPNFNSRRISSTNLAVAKLETSISTSEVEAAARALSSSPQSLFQAAYALILSSYLSSSDICFGTVFSGRTLPLAGIENIAGPCLSTLPVRVDISTSVTLQDLVQQLNSINRKHLEYSAVPLREIKSTAGIDPRLAVFDTLVIWQQTLHSYDQKRNHVTLVDSTDNLEFNLTLEIIPGSGNVVLKANYREALLPKSQIDIFLRQMEQLSRKIIDKGTASLEDAFSNLSNDLLSLQNEIPQSTPNTETLFSPVEKIAAEDPERPAIDFATYIDGENVEIQRISYLELNSRSNQIGRHLIQSGVLPNELVCICMEKSVNLYTSILATAKIGAGYLPVTPEIPLERLQRILGETNVRFIIAQSCSASKYRALSMLKIIYIDKIDFSALSSGNTTSIYTPDSISYSVYTSGSTGTPKGVLVTQKNLLSNLDALEELYPATKNSRLLQSCSQAFDVSVFEIFFTWRIGACLCSATKDVLFRDIENAIRVFRITHLSLTPTVAALVDPKSVPKVEFLVTAGEAVTQKVFNAWSDRGLYQGYGPSETTNICTVNPRVSSDDLISNIGPPLKNTSAFVLSPGSGFKLLPRGAEGEFCFGGSQVFRGYVNQRQEMGKIINHPKFGRLYRSGDFGRLMPDGCLVFTGRKDDQVKVRGQRVELGEINATILGSPEVSDCITIVIDGSAEMSQHLVSFWTAGPQTSQSVESLPPNRLTISQLYHTLETSVPEYMVPSSLVFLSCLPRTSQGKIDKRELVALYKNLDLSYLNSASRPSKRSFEHEWTDLERSIAEALSKLFNHPAHEINADTSFFSIGIDSISAISFSKTLRQITKLPVEISDILKYPSASRLAERLSHRSLNSEDLEYTEIVDFGFQQAWVNATIARFSTAGKQVQSILPCTPLQEAMLSAGDLSSENLYSNQVVFDVRGDLGKLQACWQEMSSRHGILRTCFINTDMPRYPFAQVVLENFNVEFHTIESMNELQTTSGELDPPYSFRLIEHSGSAKLILSMHHALYDGVALSVLYDEVERLYHAHSLPPAPTFLPFLSTIASMSVENSDIFWARALKDFIPSIFPVVKPQVSSAQYKASIQSLSAKSSLSWIESNVRKHNTTLLAVCHAVWAGILAERLKVSDVCFGNIVSGRTLSIQGIERLVAPCFNNIPSRLQDVHKLSYLEAFRVLQSHNADSLEFQLTPLRRIQSKFGPDGTRLFDTIFILQQPAQDLDSSIWSILEDKGVMDFPLVCEIIPKHSTDSLEIIIHSHSSIITEKDALSLLDTFNSRLQTALANSRHQILSPDLRAEIISRKLKRENSSQDRAYVSSSTEMTDAELSLRDILADFANISSTKISRDVSIFRLGLDSISAVQVAARLRKLGHIVTGSDILLHPTIARLCAHLSSHDNKPSKERYVYDFAGFDAQMRPAICSKHAIPSYTVEIIRPCTVVQQGMIARSIHSQGGEYVNSMWFEVPEDYSLSTLKAAWKVGCAEHDMLRTGFSGTDDPVYPFVMITYVKDGFDLPWFEEADDSMAKESIVHQLARPSWSLYVHKQNCRTRVRFIAHHALYDGQSIQMILADVSKAYNSIHISSRPPTNNLLGAILKDCNTNLPTKRQFWERDENKILVNRFPNLTPLRAAARSEILVEETVSNSSMDDLEQDCKVNGVTMQAASQAAWARLLFAYTGEISTTFGMTVSGRSIQEDADAISFPSIITLPVRCDVSGTNAELLSRTMNSNALYHKYQFTPLTSIQKWAGYPEGKIFDTLFAYQKISGSEPNLALPLRVVREEATVDYAVSLEVQPTAFGQVILRLTFRNDIIPLEHANLLLRQYDALLRDTLCNPHRLCGIAPDVNTHLLSITPAKENALPSPVNLLHEFVERGAETWPDQNAFEFASQLGPTRRIRSWTYDDLNKEGNKVAELLLLHEVPQGSIVGICFDKCPEASFAIIGILKAGCAYVALDPQAPIDRLEFIIDDSRAVLILSAGEISKSLRSRMNINVIALDSCDELESCSSNKPSLEHHIDSADTSYCLYTSGTTGTPKGCLISHKNAVQAMLSFQRLFAGHWDSDSKWLQFASFHFDVSVLEQFWSWSVGICVCSAPRDLIFEDIPNAIRELGVTHIDLTPSLARLLRPEDVPSLCKGVFITGGEPLKQEILDAWGDYACIYNGYGPTEATIGVTMYPRVPKNGKPDNIGPQFDNVGSFVLKPGTSLPVLRGGVGELCVSGKLVGKGYLNRPELTAERFPVLDVFDERVYRTGDLVRILYDGSFLFLGRSDDQVKLRGQRLELSEINEVIKKSKEDVREVVTLVLKHSAQQKEQLITFFVSTLKDAVDISAIISTMRSTCKARLPGYMIPTYFVPIPALPLNANNKADARQLAEIYNKLSIAELQRLSRTGSDGEHWTDAENKVVDILAPLLHIDSSGLTRDSTIFQLGLDSISVIGFSRSLQDYGVSNATLSVVKNNPTIGSLIQALISRSNSEHEIVADHVASAQDILAFSQVHVMSILKELQVETTDIESIAPCTPVQEGMIYRFLEATEPLYFNTFEFGLDQNVDLEKLLYAWQKLVLNLQILRTKFVATDDGYAQVVLKEPNICWNSPSSTLTTTEKSTLLRQPFCIHIASGIKKILVVNIFHGLYDGNSLNKLLQCVVDEYRGSETVQYGPSFHSSLPWGPLAKITGAQAFWSNHLQNWQDNKLPTKIRPVKKDITATSVIRNLEGFEEFRRKIGATHQSIVQAAWISVLQAVVSPNLTIGMIISGRAIDFEGADKVIGPLFNTVPFNVKIASGMTLASIISICHNFTMQMQDYQHTPLKEIQKWSPCPPGQSLFDSLFVFQRPDTNAEISNGIWNRIDVELTADYPLAFEANLNPDGTLAMTIVAQSATITQSEAENILHQMESILLTTLKDNGGNIILIPATNDENDEIRAVRNSNLPTEPSKVHNNGSFLWTKEALQLRNEISSLAKVGDMDVHEHCSIFELGLDSIDTIKLSSRLKKHGIFLPVSTILKCQSIVKMVCNIQVNDIEDDRADKSSRYVERLSLDLSDYLGRQQMITAQSDAILPATPLQQTMINEMLKSNFDRYFTFEVFKLSIETEGARLAAAVKSVITKTPILRTRFVEVDDPRLPVSFAQVVLKIHDCVKESAEPDLDSFLAQFRTQSIACAASSGPLFHVHVVSTKDGRYMVWAISHALYDGASLRLLHYDIRQEYEGKIISRPDYLPFLGEVLESTSIEAKRFWATALSDLPQAAFPKKDISLISGSIEVFRSEALSRVPFNAVEMLCKSSKVTLQTLGQTCWALLLAHLMGQLDVVFGSVLSCRDSEVSREVMFPLMNTVPVRSIIHGTLNEMLQYMQGISDGTRQYQHLPLGTAQALGLSSRSRTIPADATLFDTLFIYQGRRSQEACTSLYESVQGISDVEFPVCVEMEIVDGRLVWTAACKSTARNHLEADAVVEMLDKILQRVVSTPDAPSVVSNTSGVSICNLPSFMMPEATKCIPQSPLTANDGNWTETELAIRSVLHRVSGIPEDEIHKTSTIFQLGLDSIIILKIPALLKSRGIILSVSDILKYQTTSSIAKAALQGGSSEKTLINTNEFLSGALSTLDPPTAKSLETEVGDIEYVLPATSGQLYMIRMWQSSQGVLFFPSFTYSVESSLDVSRLEGAWAALLNHHDILRTGFVEAESGIMQIVYKVSTSRTVKYLVGSLFDQEKCPDLAVCDLKCPPVALVVEERGTSCLRLKLVIHHALYDGISLPILMRDLQYLYQGLAIPRAVNLKTFVAKSLSAQNQSSEAATDSNLTKAEWKAYLNGAYPALKNASGSLHASLEERIEVFRPKNLIAQLKQLAQDIGVSIDALLLASVSKVYARLLRKSKLASVPSLVFGIYLANRAPFGEDISTQAVPTLNILPLSVRDPLGRRIEEISVDLQYDLRKIRSQEMCCASLEDIYDWAGVRVDFIVNILKDSVSDTVNSDGIMFKLDQDLKAKAEIVKHSSHSIVSCAGSKLDAYMPSIDVEIRFKRDMVDMGVFAPSHMLSLDDAESLIEQFVELLE